MLITITTTKLNIANTIYKLINKLPRERHENEK